MPAGPSEVAVLADAGSNPVFVAADLLSQAEHGVDSQVLLVTTDEALVGKVQDEVERQLAFRAKGNREAALAHSKLVVVRDMDEALELTNRYAPEHLIIETADYLQAAERVVNAGSVFLGSYTPESGGLCFGYEPYVAHQRLCHGLQRCQRTATTVRSHFRNSRRRVSVTSVRLWNSWRRASISMHTVTP